MNKEKARQALTIAKELAKTAKSSVDFHNAFLGVGGKFGELFRNIKSAMKSAIRPGVLGCQVHVVWREEQNSAD